jgi:anti-anti-sigma factor
MSLVKFEREGGSVLVAPTCPRLDAEVASEFSRVVCGQVRGRSLVTIALADVESVDCSGLAALVVIHKQLAPGSQLRLSGVRPAVRELLEATGLAAVFEVAEEAAATAGAPEGALLDGSPALAP